MPLLQQRKLSLELQRFYYNSWNSLQEFDENYVEPEPEIDEEKLRRNRYLAKPVAELELSVRASNCLETANIKTIRELVTKEEKDMLEYKNFGRTSLNEIKEQLANMGLFLGMELDDMDDALTLRKNIRRKKLCNHTCNSSRPARS